jgi:hypothetical protein
MVISVDVCRSLTSDVGKPLGQPPPNRHLRTEGISAMCTSSTVSAFLAEAKCADYAYRLDSVLRYADDLDGSIAELRDSRPHLEDGRSQ